MFSALCGKYSYKAFVYQVVMPVLVVGREYSKRIKDATVSQAGVDLGVLETS